MCRFCVDLNCMLYTASEWLLWKKRGRRKGKKGGKDGAWKKPRAHSLFRAPYIGSIVDWWNVWGCDSWVLQLLRTKKLGQSLDVFPSSFLFP